MNIQLNGEAREVADSISLSALLDSLDLTGKRLAVEVNEDLVTRVKFDSFTLGEGDKVEIVQAIGGG